ncbi:serine hydrolase FSH [Bipolaris maydis]|nr:serine hydrolase FSH [Bipolaris maydis]KAJ6276708.1 serine hydrolase FSH [Bipolaris maydis]
MPPLRVLCLHGAGTNTEILQFQLRPLIRELESDHTATFHFTEGVVDSGPGPNVENFFEGPYYSYYNWPRSSEDDGTTVEEAYDQLLDFIETEGPFDAVIGFSHGGTLACGFLAQWSTRHPYEAPPFKCAIFFNSLPPFVVSGSGNFIFEKHLKGKITIPTLHVVGRKDFIYEHSLKLHQICGDKKATLMLHDNGHEIPREPKFVAKIAGAIRRLSREIIFQ